MTNETRFTPSEKMTMVISFSNFRAELVSICNSTAAKDDVDATFFDFGPQNENMRILDHTPLFINEGEIAHELKGIDFNKVRSVIGEVWSKEVDGLDQKIKISQFLPKSGAVITEALTERKDKVNKMFGSLIDSMEEEFKK